MKKRYLFIQTKSPLEAGPEAFDLALTAAAFDHEVHLVLADDGLLWRFTGLPDLVKETVEQIWWEGDSITDEEMAKLIASSDVVVTG